MSALAAVTLSRAAYAKQYKERKFHVLDAGQAGGRRVAEAEDDCSSGKPKGKRLFCLAECDERPSIQAWLDAFTL